MGHRPRGPPDRCCSGHCNSSQLWQWKPRCTSVRWPQPRGSQKTVNVTRTNTHTQSESKRLSAMLCVYVCVSVCVYRVSVCVYCVCLCVCLCVYCVCLCVYCVCVSVLVYCVSVSVCIVCLSVCVYCVRVSLDFESRDFCVIAFYQRAIPLAPLQEFHFIYVLFVLFWDKVSSYLAQARLLLLSLPNADRHEPLCPACREF
jgi:hypothetical protein